MSVTFRPEAIRYELKGEIEFDGENYYSEEYEVPAEGFVEFNISNLNAAFFLGAILPEIYYEDLCGCWDQQMQERVTKNVLKLMNKEKNPLLREDEQEGNLYIQGIDKERALRYCQLMLEVLHCCKKHNCNLIFN